MNHSEAAQALALRHGLGADQRAQLLALAAPLPPAPTVRLWFWRAVAVLAAALGGLGVVMWVAANWESFGRFGRFGLLQALVLVMGVGAAAKLRAHGAAAAAPTSSAASSLGLVAFLGIGALFAYFGQTYQTGADPWQLFALWAVLALPLCFALRSDTLWTPWVAVAATGVALWLNAHTQHSWRVDVDNFPAYLTACVMGAALAFAVGPLLRRWTGAGLWSLRAAVTLNMLGLVTGGVAGLFSNTVAPQYLLALVVAVAGCAAFTRRKLFDVYALSVFALGSIVLVMGGLARFLIRGSDWFGAMLLLAMAAAGMLAGAVRLILSLQKKYGDTPSAPEQATAGEAA